MTGKMKMVAACVTAAALGAAALCASFQRIEGKYFLRSAEVLDFTDISLTAERYEALHCHYPEKEIRWLVPFQDVLYPQDTEILTVTHLTQAEAEYLDFFPQLRQVDATQCRDYEALVFLQQRRPACQVNYRVNLEEKTVKSTDTEIACTFGSLDTLAEILTELPNVHTVRLSGNLPDAAKFYTLQSAYPNIAWHLTIPLGEETYTEETESIDLPNQSVSFAELQNALPLFPRLQSLNLTGVGLTEQEKQMLIQENPDVEILCTLSVCGKQYTTDETVLDLSGKSATLEDVQNILSSFYRLKKLYLGNVKIDNDALDALNRAYPQTDVVWTIRIGPMAVSTDITAFFPAKLYGTDLPRDSELQKLRYCPKLIAVDIGHANAADCSWLEGTPEVKYLILADTNISDLTPVGKLKKLVYLELFQTPVTDYSPLLGCTALQDLNISATHGDPEPLSRMIWLHNLKWSGGLQNPDTCDRVLALTDGLPDTNVDLSEDLYCMGGTWRYLPHYYMFRNMIGGQYLNQSYITRYWGTEDAGRIRAQESAGETAVARTLSEIIRRRLENGEEIPGIKNRDSEKVQILLNSLQ